MRGLRLVPPPEDEKPPTRIDERSGIEIVSAVDRVDGRGTTNRRVRAVRAKTESLRLMPHYRLRMLRDGNASVGEHPGLPETRGDCVDGPRPCPMISCKFNLFLDVDQHTGSVKINFPDREPWEMPARGSCALDVADLGGVQLAVVGALMNVTRERSRQIESIAVMKLARGMSVREREAFREALEAAYARSERGTPLALAIVTGDGPGESGEPDPPAGD